MRLIAWFSSLLSYTLNIRLMSQESLDRELFDACACVDSTRIEKALIAGANPSYCDEHGNTPVLVLLKRKACPAHRASRFRVLEMLVAAGADVNACNAAGETPLHRACSDRAPAKVRCLLAAGADVNAQDAAGNTPVSIALDRIRVRLVKELVAVGGALAGTSEAVSLCLHVVTGDIGQVEAALQRGVSADSTTPSGNSCLHLAIRCGHVQMVELLLRHGASLWSFDASKRYTPLVLAVEMKNEEIVRLLLQQEGVRTAAPTLLAPALLSAVRSGDVSLVRNLMEYVSPDTVDEKTGTRLVDAALRDAVMHRSPEMVEQLIALGADVNAKGYPLLYVAQAPRDYDEDKKAYVGDTEELFTELSDECGEIDRRIIAILLAHGASPHRPDAAGTTPWQLVSHLSPPVFNNFHADDESINTVGIKI